MRIWQFKKLRYNPKLYNESTFGFPARKIICYSAVKRLIMKYWWWTTDTHAEIEITAGCQEKPTEEIG